MTKEGIKKRQLISKERRKAKKDNSNKKVNDIDDEELVLPVKYHKNRNKLNRSKNKVDSNTKNRDSIDLLIRDFDDETKPNFDPNQLRKMNVRNKLKQK